MISYKKLLHILVDRDLKLTNVCRDCGLSSSVITRLNSHQSVDVKSLEKLCLYLGVNIGDVCDIYEG
jgi:putative transcriptional regulator